MSDNLGWDEFEYEVEEVTESEAKEIDSGDGLPIGLFHTVVDEATPRRIDFNKYSCIGLKLKLKVLRVLEIGAKKVEGDEGEGLEGRSAYDDIAFQHESEKDAMAKRRKMVALRLGLIKPGGVLTKSVWQNVVGKEVIIRIVENNWEDKKSGEKRSGTKVGFFNGYESIDKSGEAAKEEDWAEI